ncbi:MAG: ABC transporter ATP-binding protein [Defluviitaleaceae bacterium]|nr:ABC transporter ATP-binding protein [Defluviitaleaceae bacterium]
MKLEVQNLSQNYKSALAKKAFGEHITNALVDVCFYLHTGDILSVLGPNGSGKSTLLKCIANILPYSGSVKIDGVEVKSLKRKEIAKNIAILNQSNSNFFNFTVYERVKMGAYSSNCSHEKIMNILEQLNLEKYYKKPINNLSGGQYQRVLIASALIQESKIIMLDEPTNHLDIKYQLELIELLKSLTQNKGESEKIIISVMHDIDLAMNLTEKMLVLNGGKVSFFGSSKTMIEKDILNEVYGTNIRKLTLKNMERWK